VDLDDSLLDGEVLRWAANAVRMFSRSYGEISPSGRGVKFIARGRVPGAGARRGFAEGQIEIYSSDRYFTVTGRRFGGAAEIVELQDQADFLWRYLTSGRPQERPRVNAGTNRRPAPAAAPTRPLDASDEALLARARAARNGAKFSALWAGDISDYPSRSEADLALASILLFWTGGDAERAEALFSRSALGRGEKWRSRADYREYTIGNALGGCLGAYEPGRRRRRKP
jgi:putative DNA primase/helicase